MPPGARGPVGPRPARRALLAPDSFKGTMAASRVAAALAGPFAAAGLETDVCPLADGGEGTAEALLRALGGEWLEARAHDPLGRAISARWALLGDGRAVVESAAASGLALLRADELDAESASSRGTGELIAAALAGGARTVLVGLGGTATTDGGAGAIEALEEAGVPERARLVCLCDVRTPWERAAATFGPQKGAGPAAVARLEARLERLAEALPRDPRGRPFTGAAGGLAGGLWARFGAELRPGAAYVIEALGFERRLSASDLAVTGEGRLDATSLEGKVVGEVAALCRRAGVPLHIVAGQVAAGPGALAALGAASVREAGDEEAIRAAAAAIAAAIA